VVHVGLGDVDRVDTVEVRWPGADDPQVIRDVPADRVLTVRR
jgi:hypothetical protein